MCQISKALESGHGDGKRFRYPIKNGFEIEPSFTIFDSFLFRSEDYRKWVTENQTKSNTKSRERGENLEIMVLDEDEDPEGYHRFAFLLIMEYRHTKAF